MLNNFLVVQNFVTALNRVNFIRARSFSWRSLQ